MGGMPWGVLNLKPSASNVDFLPAAQSTNISLRHRQELPPKAVHVITVESACACQKLRRINHVRRATVMYINLDNRIFPN